MADEPGCEQIITERGNEMGEMLIIDANGLTNIERLPPAYYDVIQCIYSVYKCFVKRIQWQNKEKNSLPNSIILDLIIPFSLRRISLADSLRQVWLVM